jgi:hypothetical protein
VTAPLEIRRARKAATALHERYRIRDHRDLDVREIAALLGVDVRHGGVSGATARLVGDEQWGIIRVAARVEHEGACNFSIAHELGHRQLAHPAASVAAICAAPRAGTHVDRGVEAEANAFAAELLMPERMVRRRCEVSPVSLDVARGIAADFKASLMAAALRFVELTSERCALVFSRDRRVVWAARSQPFAPFIERNRRLGQASVAVDWFEGRRMYEGCQPVPADAWLDHPAAEDAEIWEDSLSVPGMDGVMTLLWIPERNAGPFDRA